MSNSANAPAITPDTIPPLAFSRIFHKFSFLATAAGEFKRVKIGYPLCDADEEKELWKNAGEGFVFGAYYNQIDGTILACIIDEKCNSIRIEGKTLKEAVALLASGLGLKTS